MRVWLNDELDYLENFFGKVAKNEVGRNGDHYKSFQWYNRGKEEKKMKRIVENGDYQNVELYRYIPITQLWQMIVNKELTLLNPSLWKDPLESPLFNGKIKEGNKYIDTPFKDRYFAQCFTINDTSESMWTTYGGGELMARIKVKVKGLEEIVSHNNKFNRDDFYLGRVVYLNFEDIKELFQKGYKREKANQVVFRDSQAKTLLVKRYAYNFEKEVRLVFDGQDYIPKDRRKKKPKSVQLLIPKMEQFIDEILLDPNMSSHDVTFYKNAWKDIAKVRKCNLYDEKEYQLKLK